MAATAIQRPTTVAEWIELTGYTVWNFRKPLGLSLYDPEHAGVNLNDFAGKFAASIERCAKGLNFVALNEYFRVVQGVTALHLPRTGLTEYKVSTAMKSAAVALCALDQSLANAERALEALPVPKWPSGQSPTARHFFIAGLHPTINVVIPTPLEFLPPPGEQIPYNLGTLFELRATRTALSLISEIFGDPVLWVQAPNRERVVRLIRALRSNEIDVEEYLAWIAGSPKAGPQPSPFGRLDLHPHVASVLAGVHESRPILPGGDHGYQLFMGFDAKTGVRSKSLLDHKDGEIVGKITRAAWWRRKSEESLIVTPKVMPRLWKGGPRGRRVSVEAAEWARFDFTESLSDLDEVATLIYGRSGVMHGGVMHSAFESAAINAKIAIYKQAWAKAGLSKAHIKALEKWMRGDVSTREIQAATKAKSRVKEEISALLPSSAEECFPGIIKAWQNHQYADLHRSYKQGLIQSLYLEPFGIPGAPITPGPHRHQNRPGFTGFLRSLKKTGANGTLIHYGEHEGFPAGRFDPDRLPASNFGRNVSTLFPCSLKGFRPPRVRVEQQFRFGLKESRLKDEYISGVHKERWHFPPKPATINPVASTSATDLLPVISWECNICVPTTITERYAKRTENDYGSRTILAVFEGHKDDPRLGSRSFRRWQDGTYSIRPNAKREFLPTPLRTKVLWENIHSSTRVSELHYRRPRTGHSQTPIRSRAGFTDWNSRGSAPYFPP